MSGPTASIRKLMEVAAEKRAAGYSWTKVAEFVARKPEAVRQWTTRYAGLWRRMLQEAREQQTVDAGAEALSILRTHLRKEDDTLVQGAAKAIIQRCPPAKPSAPGQDAATYVESLDETGKNQLTEALDAVDELP